MNKLTECSFCKGKGAVILDDINAACFCPKCSGEGELLWTENVFGKPYFIDRKNSRILNTCFTFLSIGELMDHINGIYEHTDKKTYHGIRKDE